MNFVKDMTMITVTDVIIATVANNFINDWNGREMIYYNRSSDWAYFGNWSSSIYCYRNSC